VTAVTPVTPVTAVTAVTAVTPVIPVIPVKGVVEPLTKATVKVHASSDQIMKAVPATAVPTPAVTNNGTSGSRDVTKRWHQQTDSTQVYNFVKESKDTSHIRNEGGSHGKHLFKPNDSGIVLIRDTCGDESSDFIDDQDVLRRPPSPCNVFFEGANVVHEGKSLLRPRSSKPKKLNISFNEELTAMFEYPSESSLLDGTNDSMRIIAKINEPESTTKMSPSVEYF